jgi:hypothetical protein
LIFSASLVVQIRAYRNDEQLLALHEYFGGTGDDGFFRTVIFPCDSHTPGDLRMDQLEAWWIARGQGH